MEMNSPPAAGTQIGPIHPARLFSPGKLMLAVVILIHTAFWSSGALAQNNAGAPPVNPNAAALQEFKRRTDEYMRIHKQVEGTLKTLKTTRASKEITDHQQQLARGIVATRQAARQGDIFTDYVIAEFRRLIEIAMRGVNGKNIRASLARSEPVRIEVAVNATYPPGIPLQSSPPTMLLNLPRLPAELDYRIVGNALVLRDIKANIIVDFMPNAIPRETGG
jgi:hypothetical protein